MAKKIWDQLLQPNIGKMKTYAEELGEKLYSIFQHDPKYKRIAKKLDKELKSSASPNDKENNPPKNYIARKYPRYRFSKKHKGGYAPRSSAVPTMLQTSKRRPPPRRQKRKKQKSFTQSKLPQHSKSSHNRHLSQPVQKPENVRPKCNPNAFIQCKPPVCENNLDLSCAIFCLFRLQPYPFVNLVSRLLLRTFQTHAVLDQILQLLCLRKILVQSTHFQITQLLFDNHLSHTNLNNNNKFLKNHLKSQKRKGKR